jgi:chromosome segregation ATPase
MSLPGKTDFEKLSALIKKPHKEQAVWFLNAFWDTIGQKEAETFWKWILKVNTLDLQKGAEGFELDELNAHRFLEFFKETMTVTEMRDNLRSTGAITGQVRMVPLTHILIFRFNVDWHRLVNASQGDNRAEIELAQKKLDEVQAAYKASEARAAEAKEALRQAEAREADAKKAEADSKVKEAESHVAKQELEVALAEVKAQEDAFNSKTADLTAKSEDQSTGQVTRNKAKAELAQHLGSDPLPLRRAKITQEAAVKKAERATKAAAEAVIAATAATAEASKARVAAEQARQQAIQAKHAAEAAVEEMGRKLDEAEAYLNEIKSKPGNAQGSLWWMDRELHEAKAYMPERKGGYRKQA